MRWRDVKQHKAAKIEEVKRIEPTLPYATIPDKIKAFITDAFLLSMPIFYVVVYLIFDGLKGSEGIEGNQLLSWVYILVPLGIIVSLFYVITGQTPGMKAYALQVIDNKTEKKPNFLLAVLRYFFFNVSLFSVVGLLVSFFREDRRGLHDLLSGTSIIKVTDE